MFDWGDGNFSEWLGPYDSGNEISSSHVWNEEGIYNVKVKAKNTNNLESDWSNAIIIGIPYKNEEIDQVQETYVTGYGTWNNGEFAQSFIPSTSTLTKIDLFMFRRGDPDLITISVRKDLNGEDITFVEKSADVVPGGFDWVEFDIPDIEVVSGDVYFIVWNPEAFDGDNTFYWGFDINNPYISGFAWFGPNWEKLDIDEYPDPDFCFKTYYAKPKIRSISDFNPWISRLIEKFPILDLLL
jgi:hypothetical protein